MKKTLSLILAAIMALSLFAGCDPVSKAKSDISSAVSGAGLT